MPVCVGYSPAYLPTIESTPVAAVAEAATIKLNKKTATVNVGATVKLKVNGTKKTVKWSTSKKSVATVSSKGVVTGKKAGKATITAKVNGKKYTCKVTVKEAPKLNKTKATVYVGKTVTLKVTGTAKKVTWSTSKKSVATVSSKGKVTAKKAGTATITAKVGTKKLTCKVTVKQKAVAVTSVRLDESSIYLDAGKSQKLIATVNPSNATNKEVTWMTENGDVAQVEPDGTVTAIGEGKTKIWAFIGEKTDYCYVTVRLPKVESVALDQTTMSMSVGETSKLTATVYPANAKDGEVEWRSSDEKIAVVDEDGNVTAIAPGTVKITAKASSHKAVCTVEVKTPTFQMGEVWTVDDQWRFKVNSVTYHKMCNQYDDNDGVQVVTVNYTYWCDGPSYYTSGLRFSGSDFTVYDTVGAAGRTYPCTHDINPINLSAGYYHTASQSFILNNQSDKITLAVDHRDINFSTRKANFVLDFGIDLDNVNEVRAFLEQDMMLNGTKDKTSENETYYYYQKTTTIDGFSVKNRLIYFPERDYFEFSLSCPSGPTRYVNIALPGEGYTGTEIAPGTAYVLFSGMGTDTNTAPVFYSQLDLALDAYSASKDFTFNVDEITWADLTEEYVQEQSNIFLDLAIAGWQDLLVSNYHGVAVDLGDLGFSQL